MSGQVAVKCFRVTKSWWDFRGLFLDRRKEPVRFWASVVLHAIVPVFLIAFAFSSPDLNSVVAVLAVVPVLTSFNLFQLRRGEAASNDRVKSDIDLCLFMLATFGFNFGFVWIAEKILGDSLLVSAPVDALLGLLLCGLHVVFGLVLFGYRSEEVFEIR